MRYAPSSKRSLPESTNHLGYDAWVRRWTRFSFSFGWFTPAPKGVAEGGHRTILRVICIVPVLFTPECKLRKGCYVAWDQSSSFETSSKLPFMESLSAGDIWFEQKRSVYAVDSASLTVKAALRQRFWNAGDRFLMRAITCIIIITEKDSSVNRYHFICKDDRAHRYRQEIHTSCLLTSDCVYSRNVLVDLWKKSSTVSEKDVMDWHFFRNVAAGGYGQALRRQKLFMVGLEFYPTVSCLVCGILLVWWKKNAGGISMGIFPSGYDDHGNDSLSFAVISGDNPGALELKRRGHDRCFAFERYRVSVLQRTDASFSQQGWIQREEALVGGCK